MTKRELQELREIADGAAPVGMQSEKRRVVLKNKGLAYRDDDYPWAWHLTKPGREMIGIVSVKDFGAKGDDLTDDTNAIEAAFKAGCTDIPPGVYHVSRPIDVSGK